MDNRYDGLPDGFDEYFPDEMLNDVAADMRPENYQSDADSFRECLRDYCDPEDYPEYMQEEPEEVPEEPEYEEPEQAEEPEYEKPEYGEQEYEEEPEYTEESEYEEEPEYEQEPEQEEETALVPAQEEQISVREEAVSAVPQTEKKKKKISPLLYLIPMALLLVFVCVKLGVWNHEDQFTTIAGEKYLKSTTQLLFSGSDISSTDGMYLLESPELIDLRNTSLSYEEIQALRERFPECNVLFSIPLAGGTVDYDVKSIVLTEEDLSALEEVDKLEKLETIDAHTFDSETVRMLMERFPDKDVLWDIEICSRTYDINTTSVVLDSSAKSEDFALLAQLPKLKSVNADECTDLDAVLEASRTLSDCDFSWKVTMAGFELTNKSEEINFNRAVVSKAKQAELDTEFEKLRYLPAMKKIDMCGCGVPNEKMAQWRDKYPDVKFIWEITFGNSRKKWKVRTDIQVFSTLLGNIRQVGDENTYEPLFLYCTDLVALDLGHNLVRDLSKITNLKKLQGLIITDNRVKDLSPLAELENFQFLEANRNYIKDVSPLAKCKNLVHADFYDNNVKDISPLRACPKLKTIVSKGNPISYPKIKEEIDAMPNVAIVHWFTKENKLRNNAIRSSFRLAFKNYKYVENFEDWEHVTYKEGVKLTYPTGYRKW